MVSQAATRRAQTSPERCIPQDRHTPDGARAGQPWVREPGGTRTGLQKLIASAILTVPRVVLDPKTNPTAIGMSINGALAFCQNRHRHADPRRSPAR